MENIDRLRRCAILVDEASKAFSKFAEVAAKVPKEDLVWGIMQNQTLSTREKKKLISKLSEEEQKMFDDNEILDEYDDMTPEELAEEAAKMEAGMHTPEADAFVAEVMKSEKAKAFLAKLKKEKEGGDG